MRLVLTFEEEYDDGRTSKEAYVLTEEALDALIQELIKQVRAGKATRVATVAQIATVDSLVSRSGPMSDKEVRADDVD